MESAEALWVSAHSAELAKYLAFWIATLVFVPLGVLGGCLSKRVVYGVFSLMILSMCMPNDLGISFVTRETYPGAAVRGFEVHLADLCAIILASCMLLRRQLYQPKLLVPLTIPFLVLMLVGVISWFFAAEYLLVPETRVLRTFTAYAPDLSVFETKLYPLFEMFRMLRGFLIFWVTVNLVRDETALRVFLWSLASMGIFLILMALRERYLHGVYRVQFELQHPNDFAAFTAMIGAALLPLVFAMRNVLGSLLLGIVALGMAGCLIMALSRSGLVIYALAILASVLLVYPRYFTVRNSVLVGFGVLGLLIGIGIAWDTLEYQFTRMVSVQGSLDERLLFNEEARLMARDHTWGVGLGNFSAWSWDKYAADVHDDLAPGVPAHNIWYLTLAELGWLGAIVFGVLWLRTYQIAWRAWRGSAGMIRMMLLGVVLATLMVHLQSLLHFSYRNVAVYQLLQLCLGILVGTYLWHAKYQKANAISSVADPAIS